MRRHLQAMTAASPYGADGGAGPKWGSWGMSSSSPPFGDRGDVGLYGHQALPGAEARHIAPPPRSIKPPHSAQDGRSALPAPGHLKRCIPRKISAARHTGALTAMSPDLVVQAGIEPLVIVARRRDHRDRSGNMVVILSLLLCDSPILS